MKKGKLETLEEIASKYSIVLMDSSILSHYFGDKQDSISIEDKIIMFEEEHQSGTVLMDYLKKGIPCFITPLVSEEFQNRVHYDYKKIIKRRGTKQNRESLDFSRKRRDAQKEITKLIYTFQENNKIFKLSENEHDLYEIYYERHSEFLNFYELKKVGFDFLIHGLVAAQTYESSALISNNFRIVRAWKHIRRKERISPKQFGFALRKGLDDFEILK